MYINIIVKTTDERAILNASIQNIADLITSPKMTQNLKKIGFY